MPRSPYRFLCHEIPSRLGYRRWRTPLPPLDRPLEFWLRGPVQDQTWPLPRRIRFPWLCTRRRNPFQRNSLNCTREFPQFRIFEDLPPVQVGIGRCLSLYLRIVCEITKCVWRLDNWPPILRAHHATAQKT